MTVRFIRSLLLTCIALMPFSCSWNHSTESQLQALSDDDFWTYFVSTWQDPSYHGYIKFSATVDDQGQFTSIIWHPNTFKYHAEHLVTLPEFAGLSSAQLDAISLYNTGRRLMLGTLLIPKTVEDYGHPNIADIQLMGKDPIQPETVAKLFTLVKNEMASAPAKMFYFPVAEQMNFVNQEIGRFKSLGIDLAETHSDQTRVCYNAGWGVGHVRIVRQGELEGLLAAGAITADDILVMDEVPRELPVVAGIVVSQTSSPSSHPALLAGMLGIPFAFEKNATTLSSWIELAKDAKPVFFQASGDTTGTCQFLVRSGAALTADEAAQLAAMKKPLPLNMNDYDHTTTAPIHLDQLSRTDADKVGSKAANVAELRRLIPEHTVTDGLALPVALFAEALASASTADGRSLRTVLDTELQALLSPAVSSKETAEGLVRIRDLIEGAKLTAASKTKILDAVKGVFPNGTRIKLRSSSNIEDHPEFNGAGLYESKGACVGDDENKGSTGLCQDKKDAVVKNVQKVWASLYSLKAWVARRYYGVDESRSGMGILVQPSFKGELANGVAISGVPAYNNSGNGEQTIEVQSTGFPGEDLEVANPPAGKVPETTMITANSIEVQIASTEVPRGRTLLADAMYRQLYEQISIVHAHYLKALNPKDKSQFKLDMEWKLIEVAGSQKIIIKQVRPVPMKISSTQGLDRGTMLVGERQAKLCPSPSEHGFGLTKLALSTEMQMSIALQEIPMGNAAVMKNPVESLVAFGQNVALPADAKVSYTAWKKSWGTQNERREYTVSVAIPGTGKSYQLQWTGRQERSVAQKRLLLNGVQSIWTSDISLFIDGQNFQPYQVVLGNAACESDAYQGFLPGSAQAASPYALQREAPKAYSETYKSSDFSLVIQARTGYQGFDKTRFMHIDRTDFTGLLDRPLVINAPLKAVYAPGHHNFMIEYAFDMSAAMSVVETQPAEKLAPLTEEEQAQLAAKGIQRLLLRTVGGDFSGDPSFDLIAVSAAGQEKVIGSLKLTDKTNIGGGGGFGIGF